MPVILSVIVVLTVLNTVMLLYVTDKIKKL